MKELHRKGLAIHPDPESCVGHRKVAGEALTGESAGQPLSCEIIIPSVPTLSDEAEGNTLGGEIGEPSKDLAQSETLSMHGHSLHGNREILEIPSTNNAEGRLGKAINRTISAHILRKSDSCIIPGKRPNKSEETRLAEDVEGRRLTKGNAFQTATTRTQCRTSVSSGLAHVRKTQSFHATHPR